METSFEARSSYGWLWLSSLGVLIIVLMVFSLIPFWQETPLWVLVMNICIGAMIGVPFLFIAFQIPKIRYELQDDALHIHMGRLINYSISYESIQSVTKKNLSISLWSSMRFPGLALFTVPYVDEGKVKMCATAAGKNILLIKTENGKYGITPKNEQQFIALLMAKVQ